MSAPISASLRVRRACTGRASRCRASYDRRLLPGETHEGVLAAILGLPVPPSIKFQAVIAEGEHSSYTGRVLRQQKFFPAWVFAEEHPFVQSALKGLRAAGLEPDYFDKEFLRLWFIEHCDPYNDATLPAAPADMVAELARRYAAIFTQLSGETVSAAEGNIEERIRNNLAAQTRRAS